MTFQIISDMRVLGEITMENKQVVETSNHQIARMMKGWVEKSVHDYAKTCKWTLKKMVDGSVKPRTVQRV